MWGIWLFRRIFCPNPHCGAPKLGQIRSNIPRCSIKLNRKWVVRSSVFNYLYKYENKYLPLLKTTVFHGLTKALKAAPLQFQDGQRSSCLLRKWSMPFSRHLNARGPCPPLGVTLIDAFELHCIFILVHHNRQYPMKVLINSFHLNGHTVGFDPKT